MAVEIRVKYKTYNTYYYGCTKEQQRYGITYPATVVYKDTQAHVFIS